MVLRLLQVAAAVFVGVVLGLVYPSLSLNGDHGLVSGPWHGIPREGPQEVDPYALAAIARDSLLPLGAAEGLSFVAADDDRGDRLSTACDYVVKGPMPAARYWTLTLLNASGFPIANPASRYGFTSGEVLRFNDEPATVAVSSQPRSGNWLPIGKGASDFVLMLRLYDTGLSTIGTSLSAMTMPSIVKQACR